MWTYKNYLQDMVVIALLIRANLCKKRFYGTKPTVLKKPSAPAPSSKRKKNELLLMNELFFCITKFDEGQKKKLFAIERIVDRLYTCKSTKNQDKEAITVNRLQRPDVGTELVTHSAPFSAEKEEQEDDEDVVALEPAESSSDLTASEVRALCLFSTFFVQS
ncbi:unnamed protein product [Mucor hiemalis]